MGYGVSTEIVSLISPLLTNAKGAHCVIAQQKPVTAMIKVAPDTVDVTLYDPYLQRWIGQNPSIVKNDHR